MQKERLSVCFSLVHVVKLDCIGMGSSGSVTLRVHPTSAAQGSEPTRRHDYAARYVPVAMSPTAALARSVIQERFCKS